MYLCILCVSMYQSVSKMGSLYSYCGIPHCLELQDICTNSNKKNLSLPSRIVWGCIIAIIQQIIFSLKHILKSPTTTILLANPRSYCLCMSYLKSPLLIYIFANGYLKEQRKILENSLKMYIKSPWKRYVMICGNHVYQKGHFERVYAFTRVDLLTRIARKRRGFVAEC